jgi:hypothetical protein
MATSQGLEVVVPFEIAKPFSFQGADVKAFLSSFVKILKKGITNEDLNNQLLEVVNSITL